MMNSGRRGRNVVHCICSVVLAVMLTVSMCSVSFASEISDVADTINAEETADIVEKYVDTGEIGDVVDTGEVYVDDSGDLTTIIPKDGDGFVTLEGEESEAIKISLPEELETEDAVATESGTVVYQTNEDVDVCVQSITDEQDGITLDGVRELVTIKDKDAPKEYTFRFNLPDGYSLVTSEEYCARKNKDIETEETRMEVEPGFVYIVDGEDEIQAVLDAPWAKDANGNDVVTSYTIDGLTLTQHVDFGEDSAFPIVADPNSHPNKVVTKKYNKTQVQSIIDGCDSSEELTIFAAVAGASFTLPKGAKLIAKFPYVNGTYIYFTVGKAAVDVFLAAKKKKYKKWLKEMKAKDKKLEEKTIYKYGRSNNRLGYYVYSISCKVV